MNTTQKTKTRLLRLATAAVATPALLFASAGTAQADTGDMSSPYDTGSSSSPSDFGSSSSTSDFGSSGSTSDFGSSGSTSDFGSSSSTSDFGSSCSTSDFGSSCSTSDFGSSSSTSDFGSSSSPSDFGSASSPYDTSDVSTPEDRYALPSDPGGWLDDEYPVQIPSPSEWMPQNPVEVSTPSDPGETTWYGDACRFASEGLGIGLAVGCDAATAEETFGTSIPFCDFIGEEAGNYLEDRCPR